MSNRTDKLIQKAGERISASMEKKAAMLKRAGSILDETGGIAGGTIGGVTGMTAAAHMAKGLGRYKALAALLGGFGGAAVGGIGGSALGQAVADKRRNKEYEELLQAAEVNRRKAMMDATAMRALGTAYTPPE